METNGQFRDGIQDRLATRGPAGEFLPLITGRESLEELRQLIIELSLACPAEPCRSACPFHVMGTLSHASLTTLVNSLPRKACEDLFQMELESRSQAAAPCATQCPGVTT